MSDLKTPTTLMDPSCILPAPPTNPWNAQAMPWTVAPYNGLMEFTGTSRELELVKNVCKRKASIEAEIPAKHFITEEKMAAHLEGLHISSEYISHKLNSPNTSPTTVTVPTDFPMFPSTSNSLPMSPKDLEEKLKNANRIIVCDEIRRLQAEDAIIPKALLSRFEKPCTALVLWQPPPKLTELIVPLAQKEEEFEEEEQIDNNNSVNNIDLNNCMDVEM